MVFSLKNLFKANFLSKKPMKYFKNNVKLIHGFKNAKNRPKSFFVINF